MLKEIKIALIHHSRGSMFILLSRFLKFSAYSFGLIAIILGLTSNGFAQSEGRGFFQTLFGGFQTQSPPMNDYNQRRQIQPQETQQRGGIRFYEPGTEINPATGLPIRNAKPKQRKSIIETDLEEGEEVGSGGIGSGFYCVRTCDGFFFPIPAVKNAKGVTGQEFCQSLCPFSEVELFKTSPGGDIDGAVNRAGKSYTATKTAFAFREKLENSCTCRGGATRGLARIDYRHDFTLQEGDILVLEQGAHVFAGGSRFPYANLNFVAASKYSKLPADMRTKLVALNLGPRARVPNEPRLAQANFTLVDAQETSATTDVRMIDIFTKHNRVNRPSILIELIRRRT